jgi:pteridine reductase
MNSQSKVALITGAAKRLGKTIALTLAEKEYHLVVHFHQSKDAAQETAREIIARGREVLTVYGDITKEKDVEKMVEQTLEHFGRIDVLVNNAAIFFRTPFDTLDEKTWDQFMDINLKGTFLCAHKIGLAMREHGGGKIINLADVAGLHPWVDYLPYSVSKAGVIVLTQGLAKALAPTVQVNAIVPGPVLFQENAPEEERQREINRTLLKRAGTPEDIARTVVFLVGSDFITGAVLPVDGGRILA